MSGILSVTLATLWILIISQSSNTLGIDQTTIFQTGISISSVTYCTVQRMQKALKIIKSIFLGTICNRNLEEKNTIFNLKKHKYILQNFYSS